MSADRTPPPAPAALVWPTEDAASQTTPGRFALDVDAQRTATRRTRLVALGLLLLVVGAVAGLDTFGGAPEPEPPTVAAVADTVLARDQAAHLADADDADALADQYRAEREATARTLDRILADLDRQRHATAALLATLSQDLDALPPDSLAAAAGRTYRDRAAR